MTASSLVSVRNLTKHFPVRGGIFGRKVGAVQAVDAISFDVLRGETLGIVGESGCGKSTTGRLLMRLTEPDSGEVIFDGETIAGRTGPSLRALRRHMQMVFQDSYASLNPRLPVEMSVAYGPFAHGVRRKEALERATLLLEAVGLDPRLFAGRYPHELSGGQRQRVNIARALAIEPRMVILDEAVSALDKSVAAQVLNLLVELKERFSLTYLFISHDLSVVRYLSDRVMVMYLGKAVEVGPVAEVWGNPRHPYTQALLAAMPTMDPSRRTTEALLSGDPPNPINPPSGCRFRTRCRFAEDVCALREPPLLALSDATDHQVACHIFAPGASHSLQVDP
jgi:peptide/nickel transport system ATP-binding protein